MNNVNINFYDYRSKLINLPNYKQTDISHFQAKLCKFYNFFSYIIHRLMSMLFFNQIYIIGMAQSLSHKFHLSSSKFKLCCNTLESHGITNWLRYHLQQPKKVLITCVLNVSIISCMKQFCSMTYYKYIKIINIVYFN